MSAVELVVRTSKPEYESGETVCGCVYLKISSPFPVQGLQLRFYGYEKYYYLADDREGSPKDSSSKEGLPQESKEFKGASQYLHDKYIVLYECKEPLGIGQYAFPFHKQLILDLPAGGVLMHSQANSKPSWRVEIVYGLQARTMGPKSVEAEQSIVVLQKALMDLVISSAEVCHNGSQMGSGDGQCQCQSILVPSGLPFNKSKVVVTAKLDKRSYRTGENMKLSLSFECSEKSIPDITSIKLQLCRYLRISSNKICKRGSLLLSELPGRVWDWICSFSESSPDIQESENTKDYRYPEGVSTVIWKISMCGLNGDRLSRGIQDLMIPLKGPDNKDLPPTTVGNHLTLIYSLNMEIKFRKVNEPLIMQIPVSCVYPSINEWLRWIGCDWMSNCLVMLMKESPYYVDQHIIESPDFSTLPTFSIV